MEWALCSAAILIGFLAIDEFGKGSYPGLRHPPNTWVNQPIFPSTAGKYAGKLCATMGNYWYKPNLRNIPTPSWRGPE